MKAEIVSVGTELLLGQTVDSNAAAIGRLLAEVGINHLHRQTVGDNLPRAVETLRQALSRADIVLTIGGLGPTQDDLTRNAVAEALDDPLVEDPEIKKRLEALMRARGISLSPNQYRQAQRPACAEPVENPNGTAPGLIARKNGKVVVCLPGPPNEFLPMLHGPVKQALLELGDGTRLVSRVLRVVGIGEAALEDRLQDLLDLPQVTVAPYAKTGEVHLRLTTRAVTDEEAHSLLAPVADQIYARIPGHIYAEGEESLEALILKILTERSQTLAVAESCTGGLLGATFTAVDGASNAFLGGLITYAAAAKITLAGVSPETIKSHGTVSEETAKEMALGAKNTLGATYGLSITGVAGSEPLIEPDGEKPSGLVYIALATPTGVEAHKFNFRGNRQTIRQRAVAQTLSTLQKNLTLPESNN